MARPVTITQTGTGSTRWVAVTPHLDPCNLSVACKVTGTVNYTVEYTYQDVNFNPNSTFAYTLDSPTLNVFADGVVNGATASAVAVQQNPIWAARVTVNSGTGSVQATFLQAGIAGN